MSTSSHEQDELPDGVVTLSRFADDLGVTVAAVTNWRARFADFPAPVDAGATQLLYVRDALLDWAKGHGRVSPGRLVEPVLAHRYSPVEQLARLARPVVELRFTGSGSQDRRAAALAAADLALAVGALALLRLVGHPDAPDATGGPDRRFAALATATDDLVAVDPEGVAAACSALEEQFDQLPRDGAHALAPLVDALRGDHMFLTGRPISSARAIWGLAGALYPDADTIVDPVCGDGGLLAEVARRAHDGDRQVRLVGQDLDPLRAATADALLAVEGLDATITVGDSSQVGLADQLPHGTRTLLVGDLPLRSLSPADRLHPTEHWVGVTRDWLARDEGARAALVVRTPWLSRRRTSQDVRGALVAEGALRAVAVGPTAGSREVATDAVVLLGPPQDPPAPVLMINLAAEPATDEVAAALRNVIGAWQSGTAFEPTDLATFRSTEEIAAAGSLAPPSYTEVSAGEVERLHRRLAKPTGDRPTELFPPGTEPTQDAPPPPPRVPMGPLRALQKSLGRTGEGAAAPIAAGDTDLGALVTGIGATPLLLILGANQLVGPGSETGTDRGRRLPLVTVVTSSADFGTVDVLRSAPSPDSVGRRGLVGFEITDQGRAFGLTPEFLAGWLSSVVVQQRLRQIVREGKTRHTSSLDDLRSLPLPAGFPDREVLEHIADGWRSFEAVRSFAEQLPEALAYWQLHLADEP